MRKVRDMVIYGDERFYCAFPSVVRRPDGELIVAFRRAPELTLLGGTASHTHPNSELMLVRSFDGGETWTEEPELIYAHPMGGSQDPCMNQLADGSILCSSYLWVMVRPGFEENAPEGCPVNQAQGDWQFAFAGGYLMRSTDGGHHWEGPIRPPAIPGSKRRDPWGDPLPAHSRGAMLSGSDGLLYWIVAQSAGAGTAPTSIHLLVSADSGSTWDYRCPVAVDKKVAFNETSLYETDGGDLVAFVRTAELDGRTVVVRSRDRGQSFEPWVDSGFFGFPHHASRLPDGRALLVYGYRRDPYGIRARALNAECTDFADAEEFIIRDDAGAISARSPGDLGYPWSVILPDGRALVTYYFPAANERRVIAGTVLEV